MTPDAPLMAFHRRHTDTFSPLTIDDICVRAGVIRTHAVRAVRNAVNRDLVRAVLSNAGVNDVQRYRLTPQGERYIRGLIETQALRKRA